MTEEQIKEAISRNFVHLIASRSGFKCGDLLQDHGVDLVIRRAIARSQNGRTRYLDDGRSVDVQLKATTHGQLDFTAEAIKYDLAVKSYNDLVHRRNQGDLIPLILVLLVLPDDPNEWVTVSAEQLIVRRSAYWYRPQIGSSLSQNAATIRIDIPPSNVIDLLFFGNFFQEVFE
jgi:hypothetical protein